MITKEEALNLINEHVTNKNIVKHMLATEAVMKALAQKLGGVEDEWAMTGLLHDGDYCESVPREKQGIQITEWAREKGFEVPENVAHAMAAHNKATGVEPKTLMDWTIFLGDSLTGLIIATCLVLPSKKLSEVTPEMVLRRFKEKSFAAGTRREDIILCQEKLGLSLEEFVKISLESMQKISDDLGL